MVDGSRISSHIQLRLRRAGLTEVTAIEAAQWLDDDGVLKDSPDRPGKPLRHFLREALIANAEQRPSTSHGRWFIRLAEGPGEQPIATLADHGSSEDVAPEAPSTQQPVIAWSREGTEPAAGEVEEFSADWLRSEGFRGFLPFNGIDIESIPRSPGVYVVLRESTSAPTYLDVNPGGWFKGKDPTVPVSELAASWPEGATCVYIGKAGPGGTGGRGLRKRLSEFRRFGDGQPAGHQGGRRIWQLADADDYLIAWLETPEQHPGPVEASLIARFVRAHGRLPIGNRTPGG